MSERIRYSPEGTRSNLDQLLLNTAPGKLPNRLDLALSDVMVRNLSKK